jgi:hypothetical protein
MIANPVRRGLLALVWLFALLVLPVGNAQAQPDLSWDHYKVYDVTPLTFPGQVTLLDQFGATTHQLIVLDWFANPVSKQHGAAFYGISRPDLHYTWWRLDPEVVLNKDLVAINQFGSQPLHIDRAVYLLNPALKNFQPGQPLPVANHYKCYACSGPPINTPVFLTDQFYSRPATVLSPRFFCTPVDKVFNGQVHPMVNPNQHYTVYDIEPGPAIWPATFRDQFISSSIDLRDDRLLMVPTEKVIPTDADPTTWGRLKSYYR